MWLDEERDVGHRHLGQALGLRNCSQTDVALQRVFSMCHNPSRTHTTPPEDRGVMLGIPVDVSPAPLLPE
eukprot:scaffold1282_cov251-Pinguiococcus_pyrenoidosus.AAC.59